MRHARIVAMIRVYIYMTLSLPHLCYCNLI